MPAGEGWRSVNKRGSVCPCRLAAIRQDARAGSHGGSLSEAGAATAARPSRLATIDGMQAVYEWEGRQEQRGVLADIASRDHWNGFVGVRPCHCIALRGKSHRKRSDSHDMHRRVILIRTTASDEQAKSVAGEVEAFTEIGR